MTHHNPFCSYQCIAKASSPIEYFTDPLVHMTCQRLCIQKIYQFIIFVMVLLGELYRYLY